jgi:hypothetical protein
MVLLTGSSATVWAQPSHKPADQCFLADDINGFNAVNDRTLYIRVGVRDIYRLDLMTDCAGLSFRESFGLKTTPANPWVCSPLDATVVFHEPGEHAQCPVQAIHKLTAAEVAALPKRDKP